jgi:3-phosphoshikimate 1-carboxyvinyltransferase
MKVAIRKSRIAGLACAPSSKSYTIRGLVCAALAAGESQLARPLVSDDSEACLDVLAKVGVRVCREEGLWRVRGGKMQAPVSDLFCRDSAATLRFMTAICSTIPGKCRLTAGFSLERRPIDTLISALKQLGAKASIEEKRLAVIVEGGKLAGGRCSLRGDVSSQFVSALMLVSPLSLQPVEIRVSTSLESAPYVLMTLECLRQFGVSVLASPDLTKFETKPQSYRPAIYEVEGDWSSASYLLAAGALAGETQVKNLNPDSLQGDKIMLDFLRKMGASVEVSLAMIRTIGRPLKAIDSDLTNCIDLLPTLAVLAALAKGTSRFTGIRRARLKESDRVAAVSDGLQRAGVPVFEESDCLIVTGTEPHPAVINANNDHRIAMAFSLLGISAGGVTIQGAECVSKTYPEYWQVLRDLGARIDEQ